MTNKYKSFKTSLHYTSVLSGVILATSLTLMSAPAMAQGQTGSISGYATTADGTALAGVRIEATSPYLPRPRITTTGSNGRYQLPLLPPGNYTLKFRAPDGTTTERSAKVLLQQKIKVNVTLGQKIDQVVARGTRIRVDSGHASLKDSLGTDAIEGVPVGQDYRDLLKLIPGVQYTEDTVRGPSAGGHGQDNIYQFDGVDVTLPLFGTLSAEPSTQDIEQVSFVRGGAKAIGFNRSGGFTSNTISKRGTNEFHAEVGYKRQDASLSAEANTGSGAVKDTTDLEWWNANISGPVIKDMLYFYGSYYRPTVHRANRSNVYGEVPDFTSTRDEFFGKATFTPTNNLLLDLSYRTSDRASHNSGIGGFTAASASTGDDAKQDIYIAEGNWIVSDNTSINAKFTDFSLKTRSRPDTLFDVTVRTNDPLDINNLDQLGRLIVPTPNGDPAHDAFVQTYIDRYGYIDDNGQRRGGGVVGGGSTINNQDFFRTNYEISLDHSLLTGDITHNLHVGYQWQKIAEDLNRQANGFGTIYILGGREFAADGVTPVFFRATLSQQSVVQGTGTTVAISNIHSESILQSIEFNDTIENGKWTFDVGAVISKDILYGQGLEEDATALSGYRLNPGHKYKMHATKWRNMIQPRFGIRFDQDDNNSFYVNYARYNPPASSLARAASWDRNLAKTININYDANGNVIDVGSVRSSTGKLFQPGIKPRYVKEYLVGWDHVVNDNLKVNLHARYRGAGNFWEDTPNDGRIGELIRGGNGARFPSLAPPELQALGLYYPEYETFRAELGLDTRIDRTIYVIAQLDDAHTDYYEAGLNAEYTGDNFYLNASYTWSKYTGNFDQDNISTVNDANRFIGSSGFADGVGRNTWNNRQGRLRGDRPHQIKVFGYYDLPWNGRVGAFANYQSGQPWEVWSVTPYEDYTRSRSSWVRFGEPSGSRRTAAHFQLDLNYTQKIHVLNGKEIELRADVFNIFNSQTGYNIQPREDRGGFGEPRTYFKPRRVQLSVKARF